MWRRRRTALNEALHELRRPLQALALAGSQPGLATSGRVAEAVQMAATALERLDCEINGGVARRAAEPVCLATLLSATVERWKPRAELLGGSLVLRGPARDGWVEGDRWALAQALDNLVVNAIEHGGPRVLASVGEEGGLLRVRIRDCGRPLPLPLPGEPLARATGTGWRQRLAGRARHGHGLRVVRRVAAAHGGRFALVCSPGGAEAILELPAR